MSSISSTSNMEVDSPLPSSPLTSVLSVSVHPLAIIGISDHHTRVSMGGSKLPINSPTIGLLFGNATNNASTTEVSVIDAEEVETSANPSMLDESQLTHIRTKIELHQKVFPTHHVVGWYRVRASIGSNDDIERDDVLPTAEDLEIHNGWMRDLTLTHDANDDVNVNNNGQLQSSPIFALMDATEKHDTHATHATDGDCSDIKASTSSSTTAGERAREKLDQEEELPLTLYESRMDQTTSSTCAFLNVEFFLQTFEPERIAVEKVFHSTTSNHLVPTTGTGHSEKEEANQSSSEDAKKPSEESKLQEPSTSSASKSTPQPPSSAAEMHIQNVISSIDAMNARVAILLDYLHKTQNGSIDINHTLLRQVLSLIRQLPILKGSISIASDKGSGNGNGNAMVVQNQGLNQEFQTQLHDMHMMTYLASLAKTTRAVAGYTEKFCTVSQNMNDLSSSTSLQQSDVVRPYRGGSGRESSSAAASVMGFGMGGGFGE